MFKCNVNSQNCFKFFQIYGAIKRVEVLPKKSFRIIWGGSENVLNNFKKKEAFLNTPEFAQFQNVYKRQIKVCFFSELSQCEDNYLIQALYPKYFSKFPIFL